MLFVETGVFQVAFLRSFLKQFPTNNLLREAEDDTKKSVAAECQTALQYV